MEGLERIIVLAKQVLSQPSYTPTAGLLLILSHLRSFATSQTPSSRHERIKTRNFQQSAIEENGFVHALQQHVPFKPAVAKFFSDERVAAPHLN